MDVGDPDVKQLAHADIPLPDIAAVPQHHRAAAPIGQALVDGIHHRIHRHGIDAAAAFRQQPHLPRPAEGIGLNIPDHDIVDFIGAAGRLVL